MISSLQSLLASFVVAVPEDGFTIALITGGVVTLGLLARFMKKRKK